jgi:regulator of nucleoside diphosphate kinase
MHTDTLLPDPPIVIDAALEGLLRAYARTALDRAPEVAQRLLDELDRADLVSTGELPADAVTLGSSATYRDERSGRIQTVRVVRPEEADPAKMRVSIVSPIGTALLGLQPGQRIAYYVGGQAMVLSVLRVGASA